MRLLSTEATSSEHLQGLLGLPHSPATRFHISVKAGRSCIPCSPILRPQCHFCMVVTRAPRLRGGLADPTSPWDERCHPGGKEAWATKGKHELLPLLLQIKAIKAAAATDDRGWSLCATRARPPDRVCPGPTPAGVCLLEASRWKWEVLIFPRWHVLLL